MNLRKTFFILPNLFTLSSVFCGFFAITLCAGELTRESLFQAAIAICFAFFFDLADGRVARLTRTQSNLGMQLDSLADVISFGAAPALLVYKWGLTSFGLWGVVIGFLFVAAGALRLARFNVLSMQANAAKPGKFIIGLPIPVAAAVLISIVVLNHQLGGSFVKEPGQASVALLVVVLSYLMVSRIRFRSFKDLTLSRRTVTGGIFVLAFTATVLIAKLHSALIFVVLMSAYLALGLLEEVIFYRRRREEERAAKEQNVVLEAEGGARSDEEVLAELGAFEEGEEGPQSGADELGRTPRPS